MYNYKILIYKREAITPITYSMIPVVFFQKNEPIINFTTDGMISKFEVFSKKKIGALFLTETMQTEWLQMLESY